MKFGLSEIGTVSIVDKDGNLIEEREISLAEVRELIRNEKENN